MKVARWNQVTFLNYKQYFAIFTAIVTFLGLNFSCTSVPSDRLHLEGVWWDGAQPKLVGSEAPVEIPGRVLRLCPGGRLVINQCLVLFSAEGDADIGEGSIWVGEWKEIDSHIDLMYHLQAEAPIPDSKLSKDTQMHMVLFIRPDGLHGEGVKFSPLRNVSRRTLENQLSCKFAEKLIP